MSLKMTRLSQTSASFTLATVGLVAVCAVSSALAACSGDDFLPRYGDPTGLGSRSPEPDSGIATVSNATQGSTTTSASTGDSGSGTGPSATFTTVPGCTAGQTANLYIKSANCTVSWSKKIESYISSPTVWACNTAGSCHGSGGVQPTITGNANDDYNSLVGYSIQVSTHPYINPCTNDPDLSSISCNVTTNGSSCDSQASMPLSINGNHSPVLASEAADLQTWLACGAPNN